MIQHVRDDFDAESHRPGECITGKTGDRKIPMVRDSVESRLQRDLAHSSAKKVGAAQPGLDHFKSADRRSLWKLIDLSRESHSL